MKICGATKVGINVTTKGIENNDTQTNIKNIMPFEITADISLVNVGELEGRYAVEHMFGKPDRNLVYENISTIMFLNPEVAGVGLNGTKARERKDPITRWWRWSTTPFRVPLPCVNCRASLSCWLQTMIGMKI